jgi:hypothetical protein
MGARPESNIGSDRLGQVVEDFSPSGDIVLETRNNELYHMFVTAYMNGSGMHLLNSVADQEGHAAFTAIKDWYGLAAKSRSIIDHYRKKLEELKLDANRTASEYVNAFRICCQKLEAKNEGYTPDTKRERFLDQILDDDYDVVKQNLQGDSSLTFYDHVTRIRLREQDLQVDAGENLKNKARRFKKDETKPKANETASSEGKISSIPNYILYKVKQKKRST